MLEKQIPLPDSNKLIGSAPDLAAKSGAGKSGKIAVFDSGVGGVSVLAEIMRLLPDEDFLYFADAASAPYGSKDTETLRSLIITRAENLLSRGIKALVIACNTATSVAVRQLRELYREIPVLGIEPAVKPALENSAGRVLVLATGLTVREQKLRDLISRLAQDREVRLTACPGLMELIEADPLSPETERYLTEKVTENGSVPEAVVLGCTHYLFSRPLLTKNFPAMQIFDGNKGLARHLAKILKEKNLLKNDIADQEPEAAEHFPPFRGRMTWDNSLTGIRQPEYSEKCRRYLEIYRQIQQAD